MAGDPYREAALDLTQDAGEWQSKCGWTEVWQKDRFTATFPQISTINVYVVGVGAWAMAAAIYLTWQCAPGQIINVGAVVGGATMFATYLAGCRLLRGRIEVTRNETVITWDGETRLATSGIDSLEASAIPVATSAIPLADQRGTGPWGVRVAVGDRSDFLRGVGSQRLGEARRRAERLLAVVRHFQKR